EYSFGSKTLKIVQTPQVVVPTIHHAISIYRKETDYGNKPPFVQRQLWALYRVVRTIDIQSQYPSISFSYSHIRTISGSTNAFWAIASRYIQYLDNMPALLYRLTPLHGNLLVKLF